MEKKGILNGKSLGAIAFFLALLTAGSFSTIAALAIAVFFIVLAVAGDNQNGQLSVLSALYLVIFNGVVRFILGGLEDILMQIFNWADASYKAMNAVASIFNVIGFVIAVAVALLAFMGISALLGNRQVNIPVATSFAGKTIGLVMPKPQPAPQQYYAPVQQPQPAPQQGTWTCSCGKENSGSFCAACGKPRQ